MQEVEEIIGNSAVYHSTQMKSRERRRSIDSTVRGYRFTNRGGQITGRAYSSFFVGVFLLIVKNYPFHLPFN